MTTMKHKGVRPTYELSELKRVGVNVIYQEVFPDGSVKWWNERQLQSGCGRELTEYKEVDKLAYCPWCKEWFHRSQYVHSVLQQNV